jgi:hypothetical protein
MGRKRESVKQRSQSNEYVVNRDPLKVDFSIHSLTTNVSPSSLLIVRNANGEAQKTTVETILAPLDERVTTLEEEVIRLDNVKADKCYALAMSLVL